MNRLVMLRERQSMKETQDIYHRMESWKEVNDREIITGGTAKAADVYALGVAAIELV